MKKYNLLCAFAIVAATLSAQIEEMNVLELTPQKKVTYVEKSQLFAPYDGHMATSQRANVKFALKYGDRPYQGYSKEIYNIIGKQVYSVETLPEPKKPTNKYVYAVDQDSSTLNIEEFKTGQYYDVIDILITEDEVAAIKHLFNICPNYIGSVISYYVDGFFGSTKKSKKYTIARTDFESELFSGKYPRKEDLKEDYRFNDRQKAIYVLQDKDTKKKYYIPIENKGDGKTICVNSFSMNSFSSLSVNIGKLASIQNYIVVDGFTNIKHKFEGKVVLTLKQEPYICKKIAPKDGYILCALTDTVESEISYMKVFDISRTGLSWLNQQDSIDILTSLADGDWIMLKTDVDSINTLLQLRKEEEDRLKQLADAETKKELIKKYGENFGTFISQGKICVGMTKEMCVEAYGTPCEKSKSTNSLGEYEVWSYYLLCSDDMIKYGITFVHFLDGKIIEIDNE